MSGWKTSNKRKVYQRALNKCVRKLNKNIEEDNLWRGRFVVKQYEAQWFPYDDGSGYRLFANLAFIDKKTGRQYLNYRAVNEWICWNGHKLWEKMNWFIVEYLDVWRTEEDLRSDTTDYTKLPLPPIKPYPCYYY